MKPLFPTAPVFLEIGHTKVQVLDQERGIELRLERLDNGRLTAASKEQLRAGLQAFLDHRKSWSRRRALCALSARGVSLRRFTIPAADGDERQRLLALQMEGEFPLPPDALAWGYCPVPDQNGSPRGPGQEFLVAAVKRDLLEDYTHVLEGCGLVPVFTLAALARSVVCPAHPGTYSALEIGQHHSELLTIENGAVSGARVLPWGSENLTRALGARAGSSTAATAELQPALDRSGGEPVTAELDGPVGDEAETLAGLLQPKQLGARLYLLGGLAESAPFRSALSAVLRLPCEQIEVQPAPGRSSATIGLQRLAREDGAVLPFIFHSSAAKEGGGRPESRPWRWAALAGFLVLIALCLRYGEALGRRVALGKRLAEIKSQQQGLPKIDREYAFFQYYQTNQPPLIEALLLVANAAPEGARLDSATITRRGDLSLRGTMASAQQTSDFRSKLIESGFFNTVALDEQTPTADRQKITFRLSAQIKPDRDRPSLPLDALAKPRPGGKPAGAVEPAPPAPAPPGVVPGPMRVPEPGATPAIKPP